MITVTHKGISKVYDVEVNQRERQLERERQKRFHYFCWIAIVGILCLGAIALFMNLIWPNTLIY